MPVGCQGGNTYFDKRVRLYLELHEKVLMKAGKRRKKQSKHRFRIA